MKLIGNIYNKDNYKGMEIFVHKVLIHILRKISNDILLFFKLLNIEDENIEQLFITDNEIIDSILNNNFRIRKKKVIEIDIDILLSNISKVIDKVVIVENIINHFNNRNLLINQQNYIIHNINKEMNCITINTNYNYYSLFIYLNFNSDKLIFKDCSFINVSLKNPLGFFNISFIKIYQIITKILKKPFIIFQMMDFFNNKYSIIELYNQIDNYLLDGNIIKNISFFDKDEICPICLNNDTQNNYFNIILPNNKFNNNIAISICKNKHKICSNCLYQLIKSHKEHKCPCCRDFLYFDTDDIFFKKIILDNDIHFIQKYISHMNIYNY